MKNGSYPVIFSELLVLSQVDDKELEWTEIARWIKYQEEVEAGSDRWSKPHVSTPFLQSLLALRKIVELESQLHLDLIYRKFDQICEHVLQQTSVSKNERAYIQDVLLSKHRHQYERKNVEDNLAILKKPIKVPQSAKALSCMLPGSLQPTASGTSSADLRARRTPSRSRRTSEELDDGYLKSNTSSPLSRIRGKKDLYEKMDSPYTSDEDIARDNLGFLRKIPKNAEVFNALVGQLDNLDEDIVAFIRLEEPQLLGDLTEVPLPTRFIFIYLVSKTKTDTDYIEIGKAIAALMSDVRFSSMMYKMKDKSEIIEGIEEFLSESRILPRSCKHDHKIDPPSTNKTFHKDLNIDLDVEIDMDRRMRETSGLVRSGRLFGGLMQDIKRKRCTYLKDIKNSFHPQCISSILFLYFACLTPIIAFGGLLGQVTEQRMATIESLMSAVVCGVFFGLFSGQPLILLGSTGPILVFEGILYKICKDEDWDYLSLRLWIGLWVGFFLLIMVAVDASAWVSFITRYTEELFATLIAFIFIYKAIDNLFHILEDYPVKPKENFFSHCINGSMEFNQTDLKHYEQDGLDYKGALIGTECHVESNVFLMSFILFCGTFVICIILRNMKNSTYFPRQIRNQLSNFSAIIAIVSMTLLDYSVGVYTPKLVVPATFKPTWEGRDWFVSHAFVLPEHLLENPWWVDIFLAPIFALLACILIFMDQQITAVIVNRKEHKLEHGGGYHLDLFVLSILIVICSLFGLPWFVAATVLSINHVQSLTKESDYTAPGEKPDFLGVREQRLTHVMIFVLIGLSVFITPVLAFIPMPVLFGVFLFMGFTALNGLQFYERILLFFIPKKYHPNHVYLQHVPIHRVHFFTFIQISCLITLWIIKSIPETSITFPVMLVLICIVRKLLEFIFSKQELRVLDDILPEVKSPFKKCFKCLKCVKFFKKRDAPENPVIKIQLEEN